MIKNIKYWIIRKLAGDDLVILNAYFKNQPLYLTSRYIDEGNIAMKYDNQNAFIGSCYFLNKGKAIII